MRVSAFVICLVFATSLDALRIGRFHKTYAAKKDVIGGIRLRTPVVEEALAGVGEEQSKVVKSDNSSNNATGNATQPVQKPQHEGLRKNMLELINKYRMMHAAPPLVLSLNLSEAATTWAMKNAEDNQELLDVNSKYGQTMFSTGDIGGNVGKRAVESWYNQIRFYDFHSPKANLKAAYFTQMVWVKSKEIGIGYGGNGSNAYIVAFYSPVGNEGNFLHNVLPVTGSGVGKSGPSSCTEGYKFYDNSCYKFFPGPRNWLQATEKCTDQFASLASIENSGEDYFVRTLLTANQAGEAWIGLSDLTNPGTLSWVDGTQHSYGNYDPVQATFPGRRCGMTSTQTNWKYKQCNGGRGFVCRRRLRGATTFEVVLRYVNKVWTDSLSNSTSHRYQALSKHIEAEVLDTYADDDWFDEVVVDHFSKSEGKILAFCKLSFTPDDDAPADPIQKFRQRIENGTALRGKRSLTTGWLHGEEVEIVKITMVLEEKSCPSYCVPQQCAPQSCSPWCCDAYGQQYSQSNAVQQVQPQLQQQQQQQQQQQLQQPCGTAYGQTPCGVQQQQQYQPVIRPQYQGSYQTGSQSSVLDTAIRRGDKKSNRTSGKDQPADQPLPQAQAVSQPYAGGYQQGYYQQHPYAGYPQYGAAALQYPYRPPQQRWKVQLFNPQLTIGSAPASGQQYPAGQYPNPMPYGYQSHFPQPRLFDPVTHQPQVRNQLRPSRPEKQSDPAARHRPQPLPPNPNLARFQGAFPAGARGGYPVRFPGAYPARFQGPPPVRYMGPYPARTPFVFPPVYPSRPYAMAYPRGNPAQARGLPRSDLPDTTPVGYVQPTTCPNPCPDSCAPNCTEECCRDR